MRGVLLLCLLFILSGQAAAEPATARYAPVQLGVAEAALKWAERAMARGEVAAARRLAAQAALDARLTWAMTGSVPLRKAAAEVLRRAMHLNGEPVRLSGEGWAGAGGR